MANVACHKEDYGIAASWIFQATAHNKGIISYHIMHHLLFTTYLSISGPWDGLVNTGLDLGMCFQSFECVFRVPQLRGWETK